MTEKGRSSVYEKSRNGGGSARGSKGVRVRERERVGRLRASGEDGERPVMTRRAEERTDALVEERF